MLDSVLFYMGVVTAFVGCISILWPLRFVGIRSRRAGAAIAAGGIVAAAIALSLPVQTHRAPSIASELDRFVPEWQFDELHSIEVAADPERVFRAIHEVTANEIFLFRAFTSIRRGGRRGPESILNAPEHKPILEVATSTTFIYLADEAPREIVVGTAVMAPGRRPSDQAQLFRASLPPGYAVAAMNFVVVPKGAGKTIVTTETRVRASGPVEARHFAIYWRIIHPGSDILRRTWLRAIKNRAEGSS